MDEIFKMLKRKPFDQKFYIWQNYASEMKEKVKLSQITKLAHKKIKKKKKITKKTKKKKPQKKKKKKKKKKAKGSPSGRNDSTWDRNWNSYVGIKNTSKGNYYIGKYKKQYN